MRYVFGAAAKASDPGAISTVFGWRLTKGFALKDEKLEPGAKGRFHALDGLRGISALLVVLYHVEFSSASWPNHFTNFGFVRHGYLAVDLFFILSGFVIAANYSARLNTPAEIRNFLVLRFFQLYPLHLAILAILAMLELLKLSANVFHLIEPSQQPPFTGDRSVPD